MGCWCLDQQVTQGKRKVLLGFLGCSGFLCLTTYDFVSWGASCKKNQQRFRELLVFLCFKFNQDSCIISYESSDLGSNQLIGVLG